MLVIDVPFGWESSGIRAEFPPWFLVTPDIVGFLMAGYFTPNIQN
jgi:hypothetical protein